RGRGHNILGHNIHASPVCGGRQQCCRVLAVARYGLAPCLRTMSNLCLGIDAAIWVLRTALLLPLEWLQSRLSFSSNSPPCPRTDRGYGAFQRLVFASCSVRHRYFAGKPALRRL